MKSVMMGLVALVAIGMSAAAPAEPLFTSDFQNGSAEPWKAIGRGDVRLSTFDGNVSMQLAAGASARAEVAIPPVRGLYVRAKAAAQDLGDAGTCIAEASVDGGRGWDRIVSVGKARADGQTLWPGGLALPDGTRALLLRLSARGSRGNCWFDDIAVNGVAPSSATTGGRLLDHRMLENGTFATIADLSEFAPGASAQPARARFEGRLHLSGGAMHGFTMIEEDPGHVRGASVRTLPDLDIDLVQADDALIPVQRGLIPSVHPDWNWIVEPGHVWSEPGDGKWTRAALPFALQERNANCTHNGMLTFLFDATGAISRVAFEIATETCLYRKFDAWGLLAARYSPRIVAEGRDVIRAHAEAVAARLPERPVSDLPPAIARQLASAGGPEPTVYGAVWNGVHYRSPCMTRHGDYPECDVIDLPSYSTAKSIFGAVALMRLERLYPGTAAEPVSAHVPACTPARGWDKVSLEQLLDMATGHYRSRASEADENAPATAGFFDSKSQADKIDFACNAYPPKAAAGEVWAYHTSDTFLLGVALTDVLRKHRGADADLYDDVMRPLWARLKLSPTLTTTRRTEDDARQPFVGWGLTYQPDDIARIALWLQGDADGLLDRRLLDAALQRPGAGGLPAGAPTLRYRAGFWASDEARPLGCSHPRWTPVMSGYGGISVALLAPGVLFYSFGDSDFWEWDPAASALVGREGCS